MTTNNFPNVVARDSKDNAVTTLTLSSQTNKRIEGLRVILGFSGTPTTPKYASLYSLSSTSVQTLLAEFVTTTSGSKEYDIEGYFSLMGESLVLSVEASGVDGNVCKSSLCGKYLY